MEGSRERLLVGGLLLLVFAAHDVWRRGALPHVLDVAPALLLMLEGEPDLLVKRVCCVDGVVALLRRQLLPPVPHHLRVRPRRRRHRLHRWHGTVDDLILSACHSILHCSGPLQPELLACHECLNLALQWSTRRVDIEIDYMDAIKLIKSSIFGRSPHRMIVQENKRLFGQRDISIA